jgi:hypothetical protein
MYRYLREDCVNQIATNSIRTILAHLALKADKIWRHPTTFVLGGFEEHLSATAVNDENRIILLRDILTKYESDLPNEEWNSVLNEVVECEQNSLIGITEDREIGYFSVPPLRKRLQRKSEYTIDNLTSSNADGAAREHISVENTNHRFRQFIHRHFEDIDYGNLGFCEKDAPKSPSFTPGLWICTCTCKKKVVYCAGYMDRAESPWKLFEMIRNRFKIAPKVVFYDNVCHGQSYCMYREPIYFSNTRFLSDRFHESNHTVCSWRYHSSVYRDPIIAGANTSCVEQVNNILQSRKAKSVRFMSLETAVMYISIFFTLHNIEQAY